MEILAPAGNFEALKAAVYNGADAVYLGLKSFSARAKAANFAAGELREAVVFCHLYGVKVYVALNTLVKDDETSEALELAYAVEKAGADAVILQDLGLAQLIGQRTGLTMHASTQLGIHNVGGAAAARKLGFKRVILAREATLSDIRAVSAAGIQTEVFVQGALCVAFSGNCYLSSVLSGCSGNRGKCLQLCRKRYDFNGKKDYLLSTSDMMLARRMNELAKAGVCSLKIEGRLRRPEYTAAAVRLYRAAADGLAVDGPLADLEKVFNRGGYNEGYLSDPTAPVVYPPHPGHIGVKIGKVVKSDGRAVVCDVKLRKGDGLKFMRGRRETGNAAVLKDGFTTGYIGDAEAGDDIHLTSDPELNQRLTAAVKRLPIKCGLRAEPGLRPRLTLESGGSSVCVEADFIAPAAQNQPLEFDEVRRSLAKTGNTPFELRSLSYTEAGAFLTKAQLNELRREGIRALKERVVCDFEKNESLAASGHPLTLKQILKRPLLVKGDIAICESAPERFLADYEYVVISPRDYSLSALEKYRGLSSKLALKLPVICRVDDEPVLKKVIAARIFDKYVVENLYGLEMIENDFALLGQGLNIVNGVTGVGGIASFESRFQSDDFYVFAWGRPALMTFAHCPKRTLGGECTNCGGYDIRVTDDKGAVYYMRRYKVGRCYAELRPARPFVGGGGTHKLFDYTFEPPCDAERDAPARQITGF